MTSGTPKDGSCFCWFKKNKKKLIIESAFIIFVENMNYNKLCHMFHCYEKGERLSSFWLHLQYVIFRWLMDLIFWSQTSWQVRNTWLVYASHPVYCQVNVEDASWRWSNDVIQSLSLSCSLDKTIIHWKWNLYFNFTCWYLIGYLLSFENTKINISGFMKHL